MSSSKAAFGQFLAKLTVASVAAASLFLSVGCFKPHSREPGQEFMTEEEKREEMAASFLVDEVKGRSEAAGDIDGFSIPSARLYNFSVCVKDRRTQDAIKGHAFEISGGEETKAVKSDASGCVQWSEKIQFNFLGEEKYLPVRRAIKANGMHTGSRTLRIAINPWNLSGKAQDVVDLTKGNVPSDSIVDEKEVAARLKGVNVSRQLWVKGADLVNNAGAAAGGSIERSFTLSIEAALLHKDLQKQPVAYPLKEGRFKISVAVIEVKTVGGATQHEIAWRTSAPLALVKDADRFKVQVRVPFEKAESYSKFFVALRVEPVSGPVGLQNFDGLYAIGTFEQVMGGAEKLPFALKESSVDSVFAFDSFLKTISETGAPPVALAKPETTSSAEAAPGAVRDFADEGESTLSASALGGLGAGSKVAQGAAGQAIATHQSNPSAMSANNGIGGTSASLALNPAQPSGTHANTSTRLKVFNIGIMKIQKSGVEDISATTRIVRFSPVACIKDNSNAGKAAAGVEFTIQKSDGTKEKATALRTTGSEGCFTWNDTIKHKFYKKEQYFFVPVTIRHDPTGFEERRTIAVNPWAEGNLGGDLQENPKLYDDINNREAAPSRLLSTSFRFETVDYRAYEVDEFLALKQYKRVQLALPFTVDRSNSINDGRSGFPRGLRDGVYILKAALHALVTEPNGGTLQLISPMVGGSAFVCAKEGKIWDLAEFPVSDTHLMKSRSTLVYELEAVDVEKLPAELQGEKDLCNALHKIKVPAESLIDRDSGLVTPTFVAPIWIKDEQGGATAFPSDWLASKLDQKAETKGLNARDFEALRPLAGTTVDQLLAKAQQNQEKYRKRNVAVMSMLDFARNGNLEFITLENDDVILQREPKLKDNNIGIPVKGGANKLLELFNFDLSKYSKHVSARSSVFANKAPVTKEMLKEFVEGRRELDLPMAGRLCLLLMTQMPKGLVAPDQLLEPGLLNNWLGLKQDFPELELAENCIRQLDSTQEIKPFVVERKLRVFEKEETRPSDYKGGHDLSVSVGSEVSFGRSRAISVSQGAEFSPMGLAGSLAKLGGKARIFNAVSGLGVGVGVSIGQSESVGTSEGSALQSGRTLAMESIEMAMRLKRYEMCTVVRPNPAYWELPTSGSSRLSSKLTDEKKLAALSRGLLICTGYESNKRLEVRERFYSFTEQWFDGATVDPGDTRNHPWMISLRGVRDYANLLDLMGGKSRNDLAIKEKVGIGEMAVDTLKKAYRAHMPTLPGIYTWDPLISHEKPATSKSTH